MTLREKLENTGNWLFRWRSYVPLVLVGIFLPAVFQYEYPGDSQSSVILWELFCLLVSFFGLGIRIFTVGYKPKRTSGRNTKRQVVEVLNTTGIYSIVRNPLYLGNFFIGLGIALFLHVWWLTLIYTLFFLLYYERIIFAEEAYLRNKFGDEYLEWCKVTPIIIPNFRLYKKPTLEFSLKNVMKCEYSGFFGIIVTLSALKVASDLIIEKKLQLNLPWTILLILGFFTWSTLRTLKKYTTFLDVEGR